MADIRRVTDSFSVAPQLTPEEMGQVAAAGFTLVINNRPDGESPDQPAGAQVAEAAREAGLNYVHIPVIGAATESQCEAMHAAIVAASGPVLAFCRSGTRSITTWARGEQTLGGGDRSALLQAAGDAGYDLSAALR